MKKARGWLPYAQVGIDEEPSDYLNREGRFSVEVPKGGNSHTKNVRGWRARRECRFW
jgi:hypothetical protein